MDRREESENRELEPVPEETQAPGPGAGQLNAFERIYEHFRGVPVKYLDIFIWVCAAVLIIVVAVGMSFNGIAQVCREVELPNGGYVYLTNREGELIYHPRQQLIYAGLLEENNVAAAGYSDGTHGENFQGGDREVVEVEEKGGCCEVQRLSHSIRSMVSTMCDLMEDIIEQEEQKRRSELEVLHSQINPHFLYNTLDSVIWMTECGRTQEAVQMVTSLARLLRICLTFGEDYGLTIFSEPDEGTTVRVRLPVLDEEAARRYQ